MSSAEHLCLKHGMVCCGSGGGRAEFPVGWSPSRTESVWVGNCRARQSWGKGKGGASSTSPLLLQGWLRASGRSGWSPASSSSPSSCVLGRTFPAQGLLCGWSWDSVPSSCLSQEVPQDPIHHIQGLITLQHNVIGVQVLLPPLFHLPEQPIAEGQDHQKGSITTLSMSQTQQTPPGPSAHPTGAHTNL